MSIYCCYCSLCPTPILTFCQVHVLIDKTPLRRKDSTRACLAELERVRSEIRSAEGDGVNQVGVAGPLVERMASLLQLVSLHSHGFFQTWLGANTGDVILHISVPTFRGWKICRHSSAHSIHKAEKGHDVGYRCSQQAFDYRVMGHPEG